MNVFEKSLAALDKYLKETPKEELHKAIEEIRITEGEGPTVGEFMASFYRVECEKHEIVEVTETWSFNGEIETKKWFQCRLCGLIFPDKQE